MLSIIIEKEDFEVTCLYKTRWDSYPGIGTFKLIRHHNDVLFSLFTVEATWTFNKYNNIEK
jgi:hypothetical protein